MSPDILVGEQGIQAKQTLNLIHSYRQSLGHIEAYNKAAGDAFAYNRPWTVFQLRHGGRFKISFRYENPANTTSTLIEGVHLAWGPPEEFDFPDVWTAEDGYFDLSATHQPTGISAFTTEAGTAAIITSHDPDLVLPIARTKLKQLRRHR